MWQEVVSSKQKLWPTAKRRLRLAQMIGMSSSWTMDPFQRTTGNHLSSWQRLQNQHSNFVHEYLPLDGEHSFVIHGRNIYDNTIVTPNESASKNKTLVDDEYGDIFIFKGISSTVIHNIEVPKDVPRPNIITMISSPKSIIVRKTIIMEIKATSKCIIMSVASNPRFLIITRNVMMLTASPRFSPSHFLVIYDGKHHHNGNRNGIRIWLNQRKYGAPHKDGWDGSVFVMLMLVNA